VNTTLFLTLFFTYDSYWLKPNCRCRCLKHDSHWLNHPLWFSSPHFRGFSTSLGQLCSMRLSSQSITQPTSGEKKYIYINSVGDISHFIPNRFKIHTENISHSIPNISPEILEMQWIFSSLTNLNHSATRLSSSSAAAVRSLEYYLYIILSNPQKMLKSWIPEYGMFQASSVYIYIYQELATWK
jgi:hypothetical protein